jgi:UDP-glucuronate decarboxylase
MGTLNMLELAKKTEARMLFASTSEVYGDPLRHPQSEDYWGNVNPIGERSCYDEGKRVAETLVTDYNRMHGTNTGIVRIFNTYGPGMNPDDGRVMTNFITQTLRGEPMTIYGNGKQTRCFQYVDDTIEGMVRMMDSDLRGPINIGNPNEYTIKQLAKVVNPHGRIVHLPGTADDPKRRKPDIGLARSLLRWEPTITLKDGIKEMMNYYSNEVRV